MSFTRLVAAVTLATTSATALTIGATPATAQSASIQAEADAMLKAAYPADGPGAAAIVMRGGRILYTGGRGLADVENRRPITPDTVFRLGSIAKQFTAATVLQLVAEKRISLDDPISRFFPDFPQPAARATVRQLLNHTSGIQDYSKVPGWLDGTGRRPHSTAELVAEVRNRPARSEPGTAWEYNNAGYMMLGAIIEKVTGKAWHHVMSERIIRPLGLKTIAPDGANAALAVARGYTEEDGATRPAQGAHVSVAHAAGGLVASVRDLGRWAEALHGGRVVTRVLYKEMTSPARLADGSTRPYGFGLRLQELRGRPALVHGGAGAGRDTDSVYIPAEKIFVAVFANSDDPATDPSTVTRRLAALALGEPIPTFTRAHVEMRTVEPLFGAYGGEDGPPFRFFARDGRLFLGNGDNEMEAFPAGEDRFFFGPDRLVWIKFDRQSDGRHVLEVDEASGAQPERFVRTGAVPPPLAVAPEVLRSYVGTYQTETVAVTVALAENGGLTIAPEGARQPFQMRPVSDTEFRVDAAGFRIVFHPENGKVDRFTMYRGARELHGKRTGG